MAQDVWENPQKPAYMGSTPICPICGSEISGPFGAIMANNRSVKKWGCSRCPYVMRIEGGFKTVHDANPVTFG